MEKDVASSLVRNSASPMEANQPYLLDSDTQPQNGPNLEQEAALNELQFVDKERVLACLSVVRSIEPGFRYRAGQGCLSSPCLHALSTLKDCNDRDILAWLSPTFSDGDFYESLNRTVSRSGSSVASTSRHQRHLTSQRSSTSSQAPSIFSNTSSYGTPRSSLGYGASLAELPEEVIGNDESNHAHWCTHGEHPKPISTCEGWKRHEREHELFYLCMPNGPVEVTQHGRTCALCKKPDPDREHLRKHEVSSCVSKFREPLKKSRKTDIITHVAKHRVHSKDAAILADHWRYSLKKRCFSCGLCVSIFSSIMERSNHIDKEHWRQGQNMATWELSNCIRGLLLEREIQAAWRSLLKSYPTVVESNLRWDMPLAEGLQLRLEKREEPALSLAKAALQLSDYERIRPDQEGPMATKTRDEPISGPIPVAPRNPAGTTVVPLASPMYQSMPNDKQRSSSMTRPLLRSFTSRDATSFGIGFPDLGCDPSLASSAVFDDSFQFDGFSNNITLQAGPVIDTNIGDIPSQISTHAWPTDGLPMDRSQPVDDSSRIKDRLNENGALLMAQISSNRNDHPAADTGIDGQRPILGSHSDASTSNSLKLPTSNFFHNSVAQLSNHEYGSNFRNKPLPPEPFPESCGNANRAPQHRSNTPMDLATD